MLRVYSAAEAARKRARVLVDTCAGALAEAGDLTQPIARGVPMRAHVRAELAELLRAAGLQDVANLAGGMLRWRADGLPVDAGAD